MTYLGEGARLRMFAVEVDYFASPDGDSQALVPRAAFVPSHVNAPETSRAVRSSAERTAPRCADSFIATLEEFSGQRVTATAWPTSRSNSSGPTVTERSET